jgi:CRP-like cAMP-binding protein
MLSPVERVLILKQADLLKDVGPRHLLGLADVAREIEMSAGDTIYNAEDPADALYIVVEGRLRLTSKEQTLSEVGPGEAFGTWALVDDSPRGHRAECLEEGLVLALHRDEFYDIAAGDLTLLQEMVRALARRLRALTSDHPEQAGVEKELTENTQAAVSSETVTQLAEATASGAVPGPDSGAAADGAPAPGRRGDPGVDGEEPPPDAGAKLSAAALGKPPEPEESGRSEDAGKPATK